MPDNINMIMLIGIKVAETIISGKHRTYLVEAITSSNQPPPVNPAIEKAPRSCPVEPELWIEYVLHALTKFRASLIEQPDISNAVGDLIIFVTNLGSFEFTADPMTRSERLKPLREMLFWMLTKFIPRLRTDPAVMLFMAHMHALALIVEAEYDNPNASYFRSLNVAPIEAFHEEFLCRAKSASIEEKEKYEKALSLLEFPLEVVANYKARLGLGLYENDPGEMKPSIVLSWFQLESP
jgi:hypothetical protein